MECSALSVKGGQVSTMLSYDGGLKEKPGVGGCHGNVHISISTFTRPLCLFALQLIQHACTHLLYKCDNITHENNRPTTTVTRTVSESGLSVVLSLRYTSEVVSLGPLPLNWEPEGTFYAPKARRLRYVKLSLIH